MGLLLDKLVVEAYRGLQGLELPDLAGLNLLVGPNNSGKTSVLEAASILTRPLDPWFWARAMDGRGAFGDRRASVEAIRWMFPRHAGRTANEVRLRAEGRLPVVALTTAVEELEELYPKLPGMNEEDPGGVEAEAERGIALKVSTTVRRHEPSLFPTEGYQARVELWETRAWGRPRLPTSLDTPSALVSAFTHRIERLEVQALSNIAENGGTRALIEGMQMLDRDIEDVFVADPTGKWSRVRIRHRGLGVAPVNVFGDGMRRVLSLALAVVNARDGLVMIDELETAVHVGALERVLPWLMALAASHNAQLIVTTHSLEAVDAVLGSATGLDLAAYHLRGGNDGMTMVTRHDREALRRLRDEQALDIR
jgi:predicted ATPase